MELPEELSLVNTFIRPRENCGTLPIQNWNRMHWWCFKTKTVVGVNFSRGRKLIQPQKHEETEILNFCVGLE